MPRKAYPTDLSERQWRLIQPFLPPPAQLGRRRITELREVVNAILYLLRSGGAWRLLPHDFPPWQTVYRYFRAWLGAGIWERIHTVLRERLSSNARKWVVKPHPARVSSTASR